VEIVAHSKNYLFQQKFQKNGTISTGILNLGVWHKKWSNWTWCWCQTKKSESDSWCC